MNQKEPPVMLRCMRCAFEIGRIEGRRLIIGSTVHCKRTEIRCPAAGCKWYTIWRPRTTPGQAKVNSGVDRGTRDS